MLVVTAMCSFLAKQGRSKTEIFNYTMFEYNEDYLYPITMTLDEIRKYYKWNETCTDSVPVAIRCFLESESYESCLRNVFSLKCDMDTLG